MRISEYNVIRDTVRDAVNSPEPTTPTSADQLVRSAAIPMIDLRDWVECVAELIDDLEDSAAVLTHCKTEDLAHFHKEYVSTAATLLFHLPRI